MSLHQYSLRSGATGQPPGDGSGPQLWAGAPPNALLHTPPHVHGARAAAASKTRTLRGTRFLTDHENARKSGPYRPLASSVVCVLVCVHDVSKM